MDSIMERQVEVQGLMLLEWRYLVELLPVVPDLEYFQYPVAESKRLLIEKVRAIAAAFPDKPQFEIARVWRTADNELLPIENMQTTHIQNTLRKLYREWGEQHAAWPWLVEELEKRTEKKLDELSLFTEQDKYDRGRNQWHK